MKMWAVACRMFALAWAVVPAASMVSVVSVAGLLLPHDASAQTTARKTLAFVVGIEHYDDDELDKLQYAADDARKIYERLKVVTDLAPASKYLLADDTDGSKVTADQLQTELQAFAQQLSDEIDVIVYLGGHGTTSATDRLWFLPTDYSRTARTRYVTFDEIKDMFADEIKGRSLHGVSLTFLLNMCGAGNAVVPGRVNMAVNDDQLIEVARKVAKEERFGMAQYALLPATSKNRNTYEDKNQKSSVFAHHLHEALTGRAAKDGIITTGSLLAYVESQLKETLPRNADFAGGIRIGVTRQMEGTADYLTGTALLAAAQALDTGVADAQREAHRRTLLDLASLQFTQASERASDLAVRATLRRTQADRLARRPVSLTPEAIEALARSPGVDKVELDELKQLVTASAPSGPQTLRALRDSLQAGEPFYAVIIDSDSRNPGKGELDLGLWVSVLKQFPGHRKIASFKFGQSADHRLDDESRKFVLEQVSSEIDGWLAQEAKAARGPNARPPRVFLIYTGTAALRRQDGEFITNPRSEKALLADPGKLTLWPFGSQEIGRLTSRWRGPVTVFYLAPFGGVLLAGPVPTGELSLLLAAREPAGMTFSGADSSVALMAGAFADGAESLSEYPPIAARFLERRSMLANTSWVVGTPAWLPVWGGPAFDQVAATQTGALQRFALQVAAGCAAESLTACDAASRTNASGRDSNAKPAVSDDPFEVLMSGARNDLMGQTALAVQDYNRAAAGVRAPAARPESASLGAARTREALQSFASTVERRAGDHAKSGARNVIVARFGIEDYASPFVPDLPRTSNDLNLYGKVLSAAYSAANIPVVIRDIRTPRTAAELLTALEAEVARLGADDLLFFVYSGRGLEDGGRRFLTTAETRPCMPSPVMSAECSNGTWTDLVDIWQIAELMKDHWFVAIYDAQFTEPYASGSFDALLDKHIDSVRPAPPDKSAGEKLVQGPSGTAAYGRQQANVSLLDIVPAGRLSARQLHVWVEGTLTASAYPTFFCAPNVKSEAASPLAASIVASLPLKTLGTYRDWLRDVAAQPCLSRRADSSDGTVGRVVADRKLVAQGNIDLPMFAVGEGAELVDYFRKGNARRDANLRAADAVVEAAAARFASVRHRLARAALLLSLVFLHGAAAPPVVGGFNPDEALTEAETLLRQIDWTNVPAEEANVLHAIQIELLARRHVLDGDPAQARVELQRASSAVLAMRDLAEQLVTVTGEAARRQPSTLLDETAQLLDKAERDLGAQPDAQPGAAAGAKPPTASNTAISVARSRLAALLRDEETRRATTFVLAPPTSSRETPATVR